MNTRRFFVEPVRMFGPNREPRWQYRVRDGNHLIAGYGAKNVALVYDSGTAERICDNLNRANTQPVGEERWQATLDHANEQTAGERLRADLLADELKAERETSARLLALATDRLKSIRSFERENTSLGEIANELRRAVERAEELHRAAKERHGMERLRADILADQLAATRIELRAAQEANTWAHSASEPNVIDSLATKLGVSTAPPSDKRLANNIDRDVLLAFARHINRVCGLLA